VIDGIGVKHDERETGNPSDIIVGQYPPSIVSRHSPGTWPRCFYIPEDVGGDIFSPVNVYNNNVIPTNPPSFRPGQTNDLVSRTRARQAVGRHVERDIFKPRGVLSLTSVATTRANWL